MATVRDLSGNSPVVTDRDNIKELLATFGATGVSGSKAFKGEFNVDIDGTFSGTVVLERSFDNGITWNPASRDSAGVAAAFTVPASVVADEPEAGVLYRFQCTAYTSGSIICRASQ